MVIRSYVDELEMEKAWRENLRPSDEVRGLKV